MNLQPCISYLVSETEFHKACVGFAKAGIFGIQSMEMFDKELHQWCDGNFGDLRDNYILLYDDTQSQLRIAHRKIKIPKCERRMRRGSEIAKKINFTEEIGNIVLSAHAVSRYRERSGQYVKPNMFWDELFWDELKTMHPSDFIGRKDLMQPTEDGAWLGEVARSEKTLEFTYRKKDWDVKNKHGWHFSANTWVHVKDMLDFQYDAWKAYRDGDDENAALIMLRNVNSNQVA